MSKVLVLFLTMAFATAEGATGLLGMYEDLYRAGVQYQVDCVRALVAGGQVQRASWIAAAERYKYPVGVEKVKTKDLLSDFEFLSLERERSTHGIMHSQRDPYANTQVYFTANARVSNLEFFPVVDPAANALVVYLPGGGTTGATGANFDYKGNKLSKLGFSTLSFDYPYQNLGPENEAYYWETVFVGSVMNAIYKYRLPGQRLIVLGHSFGASLLMDIIKADPFISNSAIALSLGSFDDQLESWALNYTPKVVLDRPGFEIHPAGAKFVYLINKQFAFKSPLYWWLPDPSTVNPYLKLRVVVGENDEFIPGPVDAAGKPIDGPRTYDLKKGIKGLVSRADVQIEKDANHLLMGHKDANGQDLVIREIMMAAGMDPAHEAQLRQSNKARVESVALQLPRKYFLEPFFAKWVDAKSDRRRVLDRLIANSSDEESALALLTKYKKWIDRRREAILENIRQTKSWAPKFYAANQDDIDHIGQKNYPISRILSRYLDLLRDSAMYRTSPKAKMTHAAFVKSLGEE